VRRSAWSQGRVRRRGGAALARGDGDMIDRASVTLILERARAAWRRRRVGKGALLGAVPTRPRRLVGTRSLSSGPPKAGPVGFAHPASRSKFALAALGFLAALLAADRLPAQAPGATPPALLPRPFPTVKPPDPKPGAAPTTSSQPARGGREPD